MLRDKKAVISEKEVISYQLSVISKKLQGKEVINYQLAVISKKLQGRVTDPCHNSSNYDMGLNYDRGSLPCCVSPCLAKTKNFKLMTSFILVGLIMLVWMSNCQLS